VVKIKAKVGLVENLRSLQDLSNCSVQMRLTSAVTLDELILFVLFVSSLWVFKWLFDIVHAGIIGQILAGVLFVSLPTKDLWPGAEGIELLGNVAVIIIIFEGGMSIRLSTLRQVGFKSFLVATLGVVLPVGSGIGILVGMGFTVTEGIAGGAALASTSNVVGVALMQKQKVLETRFGTLLTAATMIDDIYSLILLSIVTEIPAGGGQKVSKSKMAWNISRPVVASFGTMLIGILLLVIVKIFLKHMEDHASEEKVSQSRSVVRKWFARNFDRFLLCFMFFLCFACAISAEMAGASRLLGCFVAGMAFGEVPIARRLWDTKVGPAKPFLEALFFSSIGFFLPIRAMFDRKNALYGLAYAASSAITKFATAVLIRPWTHGVAAGLAMITRGELGLLLAQQALSNKILSESCFIVVCWAVILCTLFPPFFFGILIKRFKDEILDTPDASQAADASESSQST
jgi:Kef-type K+ transport system membrane component KefB